jgi:hypothetical protein
MHVNAPFSPTCFYRNAEQALRCRESATGNRRMTPTEIAMRHFSSAIAETETSGQAADAVCRALLGLVVTKYLESRTVADVQSELRFVADNCDPDTDFMFMRP